MTVFSEPVADIAGADSTTVFAFTCGDLRENYAGTGTVETHIARYIPVAGVLTTGDLDPGPAIVSVGLRQYSITIPDSPTPIRLWPVLQEALPVPPSEMAHAVINAGDFASARTMSAAEYADLTSTTTPARGSTFFIY